MRKSAKVAVAAPGLHSGTSPGPSPQILRPAFAAEIPGPGDVGDDLLDSSASREEAFSLAPAQARQARTGEKLGHRQPWYVVSPKDFKCRIDIREMSACYVK